MRSLILIASIIAAFYCNLQQLAAQTLPESVLEVGRSENEEYLDQQIRREKFERESFQTTILSTAASVSGNNNFTGFNTHSGTETFTNTVTITGDLFAMPVSSQTVQAIDWTSNNTSFVNCTATITVTTNGSPIRLMFNGHLTNDGSARSTFATIYQDGNFISPFSQTLAMAFYKDGNGGNVGGDDVTIDLLITPSAGTHSYCLAFRVSAGIWTVENDQKPSIFRIDGAR